MNYLEALEPLVKEGHLEPEYYERMKKLAAYGAAAREAFIKEASAEKIAFFGAQAAPGLAGAAQSAIGALKGGASRFLSNPIGQNLALGGALAAGGAIAGMMTRAFQGLKIKQAKSQMLELFPDLRNADQSQLNSVFDTVAQIAPHVAGVPRLVGTFVHGVLQFPGATITPDMAQNLMRLEEQLLGQPGMVHAFGESAARQAGGNLVEEVAPSAQSQKARQDMRYKPIDTGIQAVKALGSVFR